MHINDVINTINTAQYLTVDDVAAYMNISRKTIYDWCSKGYLPCVKLGRLVRIDKNDLIERLKELKNNSQCSK
jgi:excisionase family DNA binding protein